MADEFAPRQRWVFLLVSFVVAVLLSVFSLLSPSMTRIHSEAPVTITPTCWNYVPVVCRDWSLPPAPLFESVLVLDETEAFAQAADSVDLDVGDREGESLTVEALVDLDPFRSGQIVSKPGAYLLSTEAYSAWVVPPIPPSVPILYQYRCLSFSVVYDSGRTTQVRHCHSQYGGGFHEPGWHHVVGVWDGTVGEIRLYMDGERLIQSPVAERAVANSAHPLRIGEELTGRIEQVRISGAARYSGASYPYPWSESTHSASTLPSAPFACDSSTAALWHFDEAAGSTVFYDGRAEGCGVREDTLAGENGAHTGS